jgi:hypothetical protein
MVEDIFYLVVSTTLGQNFKFFTIFFLKKFSFQGFHFPTFSHSYKKCDLKSVKVEIPSLENFKGCTTLQGNLFQGIFFSRNTIPRKIFYIYYLCFFIFNHFFTLK